MGWTRIHARLFWRHLDRESAQRPLVLHRRYSDGANFESTTGEGERLGLPQHLDLLERYRNLVTLGKIQYDTEQVRVVMQLRRMQRQLTDYTPKPPGVYSEFARCVRSGGDRSWWQYGQAEVGFGGSPRARGKLQTIHSEELENLDTPKGLLVIGKPGCGKSMLIDMWFSSLPTPYKVRKHYSQLVLEIYRGVWEETQRRMAAVKALPSLADYEEAQSASIFAKWRRLTSWSSIPGYSRSMGNGSPTIAFTLARRLILHHWLLVFDEIQLMDVTSAGLLADILSWYWRMGGVIVGTSNKIPEDLCRHGVQWERLQPFVDALKVRCPVMTLQAEKDWRRIRAGYGGARTWFVSGQEEEFESWLRVVSKDEPPQSRTLSVFNRSLHVPWASGRVCKFDFAQLCDTSLGHADYLTLASTYHTIIISSIPRLSSAVKNQARRFISLLDALYESRCRLICLAETEPEDLFHFDTEPNPNAAPEPGLKEVRELPNVALENLLRVAQGSGAPASVDKESMFTGRDEQFAFQRALSRLIEMTSATYRREEKWIPLPSASRKWEEIPRP